MAEVTQKQIKNALFHYTTADGLIGIITNNELWSTAYYCTNDDRELLEVKGIFKKIFNSYKPTEEKYKKILDNTFGLDVLYEKIENFIFSEFFSVFCAYITCFSKPYDVSSYSNGILSQWRGYGDDGGYSIQFNYKKLREYFYSINRDGFSNFEEVSYKRVDHTNEILSKFKDEIYKSFETFLNKFKNNKYENLETLFVELWNRMGMDAVMEIIKFSIYDKNSHFFEERECRLSLIEPKEVMRGTHNTYYYNRHGQIVPYKKILEDIKGCIDAVIIGPNSRMDSRKTAVEHLLLANGLKDVEVRASEIPFVRE